MRVELFDYHLPPGLIAQHPAEAREDARLLLVNCETGSMEHGRFPDLAACLEEGDCMAFNTSRVRRARLRGRKKGSGGAVELLLLAGCADGTWNALARPARRLRPGAVIAFGGGELEAEVVEKGEGGEVKVRLEPAGGSVEDALERCGEVPLPPYIRGEIAEPDRYQTVYACEAGSAAAPTAGLHFESETMCSLEGKGVRLAFLRLDIGLDTFRPMAGGEVEEHRIHSEYMALGEEACAAVNETRREGGRVVAVGTTAVRALESAAVEGEVRPYSGPTQLFIYPGFRFQATDCMLTNFHMPRTSLLALVCAFAGRELVMEAYHKAVEEGYRFLSFGDACYFHYPHGWRGTGG